MPGDRLTELREAATPRWRSIGSNLRRWSEMLASLGSPVPSHEESEPYLGALLAYLDENGVIASEPPEHEDLLMDLVEFHRGGWDLLVPRPGLVEMLDPVRFDESALRSFYEDGGEPCPESGAAMLRSLAFVCQALGGVNDGSALLVHHR